jgi:hypothetical protein
VAKFTNRTTLGDSQIFDNGTNVGVGTANPTDKFDVRGNIKSGSNGEFFGTGGIENLLLVRGMVNRDGTSFAEPAFSVRKPGTGQYVVTLTTPPPFNGSCFAVVTPFSDDGSVASAVITSFTGGTIGFSFLCPRLIAHELCRTVASFSSGPSQNSTVHGTQRV